MIQIHSKAGSQFKFELQRPSIDKNTWKSAENPRLSIRPEKNTGQVINMKYINNLASLKVLAEHFDVNDRKYH